MGATSWELSEFGPLRNAYTSLSGEADAVISKANESPNILVYGLFSMGVIGWWMQLGQLEAQKITVEVKRVLDVVGEGVEKSAEAYGSTSTAIKQKISEVEKTIDDVDRRV